MLLLMLALNAPLFDKATAPVKAVVARRPKVVAAPNLVPSAPVSEPPIEIFAGSKRTVAQNGEAR